MIKKGLKVRVLTGKDRKKEGEVIEIDRANNRAKVKEIKVRKNYNAHDENNKFKTGDKVSIVESKPFSKNKKFQVMENTK